MNNVIMTGYVSTQPELKHTQQGKEVCTFRLCVKNIKRTYDFFTIVCWNNTAEYVTKNFSKGDGIEVLGRIQEKTWTDSNTGKKRSTFEIVANNVEFSKTPKHQAKDATVS